MVTLPTSAHEFVPKNSCPMPDYTVDYLDRDSVAILLIEIENYRICLDEYFKFESMQPSSHEDGLSQAHADAAAHARQAYANIERDFAKHAPKNYVKRWDEKYGRKER